MTLPWSEDWAWQSPLGSQQMTTLLIDVMRSSVTKHASCFDIQNPYPSVIDSPPPLNTSSGSQQQHQGQAYKPLDMPQVPVLSGSPPLMMYGA